jgi:hypothetical protein
MTVELGFLHAGIMITYGNVYMGNLQIRLQFKSRRSDRCLT